MLQFLGHIGSFPIRSYSILFVLACILGIGVTVTLAKLQKKNVLAEHLLNLAVPMFIGAILGSRFWQVFLFDWGYYSKNPGEIIAIWHGGLSIQGGIVGAVLVAIWYVRKHKISFWELADLCAPGLILGQSIGRDANLMNGDAFGDPTGGNWGILYPEGTNARTTFGDQPLYPAEVWEGQMDVIIFAIVMMLLQKRLKRGYLFLITNVLYNIGRFLLEMLRGDTPKYMLGWTTAQWTSVSIILICILAGFYLHWKQATPKDSLSDQ
ncbi:prolipoprotein diacylglyceryl transferase [Paenibacillus sp. CGMCC 1.16610]|uniref:Phosphatidylglycerol--prolipoprotein diacylglyceryl transferase n=1 Tax=Paenibacillus anseongense TaxID=2682845 RepID=A0ABW9UJ87_9BACL|nr:MULTISPECIES: prolipoprotein diacylglyceryl transferase [Paenibacillus]MBA2939729.1 prolipoprotein diacylglyceryl transferase [Paenibacillus sp. CGMCC 1.16610]MVQ39389.1 prolipoprotein diacylglyceryl transferase [Paenibacillus anseongense]